MFGNDDPKAGSVSAPLFASMMDHLQMLSEIHNNLVAQSPAGEDLVEKIEKRMNAIFDKLPEGQVR